jgi:zinc D-Ala-D-Ala carboxypeptidase
VFLCLFLADQALWRRTVTALHASLTFVLNIKSLKLHIGVVVTALAVAVSAQSPRPVRKTSATSPVTNRNTTAFAAAATANSTFRNELTWAFGGKQQRGWYLYDLLIGKTLNTLDDPGTSDFAASVATWQKRRGITADGVLDEDALMAMISQWQGNRLKSRTYATPDQLMIAPVSDFYDPSRADELRQVERSTYAAYKQMVAAAIADPTLKLAHTSPDQLAPGEQYFKIISAFRSRDYQDNLRRKSPNAGSAGLAVNFSPHFTGRALDVYVGGSPVETKDSNRAIQVNTPAYRWLVKNAERFGFRPYFYEPWHWEYVK